jgi:SSS family solute:Na+ symporter
MTPLIVICCYLALLLLLGLFSSRLFRGTSADYLLASHSIGPFLLLMSIFGTTMTAFALVGSSGEAYAEGIGVYGMLASSSGIVHSLCFFVVGVKAWSLGRKYGYTTQSQLFRDRLESDGIGLLLFPILVGLVVPYLLIGVIASGTVINSVTEGAFTDMFAQYDYGVPPWIGSLVVSAVVLVYVFFGGMRGTAWANTFQTIIFMILGVVTFFLISDRLGGVQAASEAVLKKHPSKLMRDVSPDERKAHAVETERWKNVANYNWLVEQKKISLSDEQKQAAHAADPVLVAKKLPPWAVGFEQRRAEAAYAVEHEDLKAKLSDEEKMRAMLAQDDRLESKPLPASLDDFHLIEFERDDDSWEARAREYFKASIGHPSQAEQGKITRKQAHGRYRAMRWAPEKLEPMPKLQFFTYLLVPLSVGMFPHLFQHWLTARKASNFKLAVVAHPLFIMIVWAPCVLVGVWATSAMMPDNPRASLVPPHFPPNAVLAYMVKQLTSEWLTGLLIAGVLAAIMSSLDSQFLCIGTMFTTDVVVRYAGPNRFSDKQKIFLARSFIVAIVAITYLLSLLDVPRVFTLGVWCFSGFAALFPLIVAALYWRRLTAPGAYAAVLATVATWIYFFAESDYGRNPNFAVWGMQPVAPMVLASLGAMVLVSLVTRPPSEATLQKFFPK